MARIFISYRRQDSATCADQLARELRRRLSRPEDRIYLDVGSARLGENYLKRIERELAASDVVVALIGADWCGRLDSRRRIDDPSDLVRRELVRANELGVTVVPVLLDQQWADHEPLPAELCWIRQQHAALLRSDSAGRDLDSLVAELVEIVAPGRHPDSTEAAVPPPSERATPPLANTYVETINARYGRFHFGGGGR